MFSGYEHILFLIIRHNVSSIKPEEIHCLQQPLYLPIFIPAIDFITGLYCLCNLHLFFHNEVALTLLPEIEEFTVSLPELQENMVLKEPATIL